VKGIEPSLRIISLVELADAVCRPLYRLHKLLDLLEFMIVFMTLWGVYTKIHEADRLIGTRPIGWPTVDGRSNRQTEERNEQSRVRAFEDIEEAAVEGTLPGTT